MVYLHESYCTDCGKLTKFRNSLCNNCEEKKKRIKVATWSVLTGEEKIEELKKRIEQLESKNVRYG